MGTLENERPPINLDVVEVSSGAVNPSNEIHLDHDRDDLRDHKGIDSGSEDATDPDANLLPDGSREDRSSDYCSSEQVPIEKLQTVGLEGEKEEEDEVKAGEGEIGSVGLEGGEEVKVEEKVEELKGGQEDNKGGNVDWGRLDDEKADFEEEWKEYGIENAEEGALSFPLRPGAEDCSFYMKTGSCKFGPNCKFNHPLCREKKFGGGKGKENGMRALSDDPGKMECKFYLTPGGCKFGKACKYDHSKAKTNMGSPELNFLGLPIRPGEKKCPFYLRTGSCGYGSNCRFDHPDPTAIVEDSKHTTPNGQSHRNAKTIEVNNVGEFAPLSAAGQSMSMSSSLENSPSYMPYMNSLSQGVSQVSDWNHYQPHFSENTMNPRPAQVVTNSFKRTSSPGTHLEIPTSEEYPERPGLPECDYFMKTGNCKFRSQCRYHHPKSRLLQSISNGFNHNGVKEVAGFAHQHSQPPAAQLEQYPERPGEPECSFFMKTGDCKYKSLCKYHHPSSRTKSNVSTMYRVDGRPSGMATPPALPHEIYRGSDSYPNNLNQKAKTFNKHQQQPTRAEEFPQRPGQPECDYFLKTGKCKYGSNCRYDHPKDGSNGGLTPADSSFVLNEKGLPLRPGANICRNYEQLGICKYGPRCLYDHPINKGCLSSGSNPPVAESPLIQDAGSDDWGDGWA